MDSHLDHFSFCGTGDGLNISGSTYGKRVNRSTTALGCDGKRSSRDLMIVRVLFGVRDEVPAGQEWFAIKAVRDQGCVRAFRAVVQTRRSRLFNHRPP